MKGNLTELAEYNIDGRKVRVVEDPQSTKPAGFVIGDGEDKDEKWYSSFSQAAGETGRERIWLQLRHKLVTPACILAGIYVSYEVLLADYAMGPRPYIASDEAIVLAAVPLTVGVLGGCINFFSAQRSLYNNSIVRAALRLQRVLPM